MARFWCIILGTKSVNLHLQDECVLILSSKHKYVHLKTQWASHTIHQNHQEVFFNSIAANEHRYYTNKG